MRLVIVISIYIKKIIIIIVMYLVHDIIIFVNLHKYFNFSNLKEQVTSVLWRNMSKDHCYERLSQFFFAFETDGNLFIFGSKLPTA